MKLKVEASPSRNGTPPPSPSTVPPKQTFEFEVVTITDVENSGFLGMGKPEVTTSRRRGKAEYRTEDLGNGVQLEMVFIPGGTFLMGSPEGETGRSSDEGSQHLVRVSAFWMGKYPVTQAQWKAVATLPKVQRYLDLDPSRFKGADRPVEKVSWYEAVEFCQRLSKATGREYRLPSEAEWEYACRAGTTTPFYFGETITGKLANYDASRTYAEESPGKEIQETTPVGQFPPNAFGLYDMHGNVWEWCADDWHDNYNGAPTDGSAWLRGNDKRSPLNDKRSPLRGGSWGSNPLLCRSAIRFNTYRRDVRFNINGFRMVCGGGRT